MDCGRYEEIFWNHIPGENRLFRKLPTDSDWVQINMGAAVDASGCVPQQPSLKPSITRQLRLKPSHPWTTSRFAPHLRCLTRA